ncbi:MAG: 4Fe-4S dicluster domain-containing protein [Candidatus Kryptoniota bacterium]
MDKILKLSEKNFQQLLTSLKENGYTTVGPVLRDGAIVYDRIDGADELPIGWIDDQAPSAYRLVKQNKRKYFGFHAAPQSWKRFLYPPQRKLFSIKRNGKSLEISREQVPDVKYAFIGVRACELSAILIQDMVFDSDNFPDQYYKRLRQNSFVVAVNCTDAGGTCFCASMNSGPKAKEKFDLAITEILTNGDHYFIAEIGSERGSSIMGQIKTNSATKAEIEEADKLISRAENKMRKVLKTKDLPKFLSDQLESSHWDDMAKRCLACGNCTMVCPTCFCSTVEDVTDLSGQKAERVRKWDSCFAMDFSKVAGGNFRITPKSRYRQRVMHKFSYWMDQFGILGCVGCGRCTTWCPVGIDVAAEIQNLRNSEQ